jgi:hypothetical protein
MQKSIISLIFNNLFLQLAYYKSKILGVMYEDFHLHIIITLKTKLT